jgi:hypothetical protein
LKHLQRIAAASRCGLSNVFFQGTIGLEVKGPSQAEEIGTLESFRTGFPTKGFLLAMDAEELIFN